MFAGGITPAFVFHCANQNGVKKSVRAYGGFARGLELGVTGGFTAIGYENDDVATLALLRGKATGTENDGVVDGCTCAGRNFANGILEHGDFVGEVGNLRDVLVEAEDGQVITGANDLLDEMSGGGALGRHADLCAKARVNHERKVERLLGFAFENFNFLWLAFFDNLKSFDGQVCRGTIIVIENADENVYEIDLHFDGGATLNRVVGSHNGVIRLGRFASSSFVFLRPGRTIGILLRNAVKGQSHGEQTEAEGGAQGCRRH